MKTEKEKNTIIENIQQFENTSLHIKNIIEGAAINRFNFTKSEMEALRFAHMFIDANKQDLQDEQNN